MMQLHVRAARALIKLGVREVGDVAGVTPSTVSRVEQNEISGRGPQATTIAANRRIYEAACVVFIAEDGEGPRMRPQKEW